MDALKDLYENYFKKEYLKFFDVGKTYLIKPFFIEEFEDYEKSKKPSFKFSKAFISMFLSNKLEKPNVSDYNAFGILKPQKRILETPFEINLDKNQNQYYLFCEPYQDVNELLKEDEKDNKDIKYFQNIFKEISSRNINLETINKKK